MLDDISLGKLSNGDVAQGIFKVLTTPGLQLDSVDGDRTEYKECPQVPDVEALAERLRACLEESDEMPADFRELFDHDLFSLDCKNIPETVKLFQALSVKHEPLGLIPPQFEVPLPPLQPAVFMPTFREPPAPSLDLFDLDEHLASEKLRLAQLTNKCSDLDLDYYVREVGETLGISDIVRKEKGISEEKPETKSDDPEAKAQNNVTANEVLAYVLKKLANYKKIDQSAPLAQQQKSVRSKP